MYNCSPALLVGNVTCIGGILAIKVTCRWDIAKSIPVRWKSCHKGQPSLKVWPLYFHWDWIFLFSISELSDLLSELYCELSMFQWGNYTSIKLICIDKHLLVSMVIVFHVLVLFTCVKEHLSQALSSLILSQAIVVKLYHFSRACFLGLIRPIFILEYPDLLCESYCA